MLKKTNSNLCLVEKYIRMKFCVSVCKGVQKWTNLIDRAQNKQTNRIGQKIWWILLSGFFVQILKKFYEWILFRIYKKTQPGFLKRCPPASLPSASIPPYAGQPKNSKGRQFPKGMRVPGQLEANLKQRKGVWLQAS